MQALKDLYSFAFDKSGSQTGSESTSSALPLFTWLIHLALIILPMTLLAILAGYFPQGSVPDNQLPLYVIGLYIVAGIAFFGLVYRIGKLANRQILMSALLLAGVLLKLPMLFSQPLMEVDYFRYQWDGAVTAGGFNPFQYSPEELDNAVAGKNNIPSALQALADENSAHLQKINHSELRTIYPPLVQLSFALAHWLQPFSAAGWRFILLLFDIATMLILLLILKDLGLSPLWIALYWLNPLLAKEIFNSLHMDILIFPFLLLAIRFSLGGRVYLATAFLALATGVKIWPALLLPIILRPACPNWQRLFSAALSFGGLTVLLFLPVLMTPLDADSGFSAYSTRWALNDSAFRIIWWSCYQWLEHFTDTHPGHAQLYARIITAGLILLWTARQTLKWPENDRQVYDQCLLIIAALFLLSPTQFPWYALWLMPLLVINPRKPLLFLAVVMPLYYLWYYFDARGQVDLFHNVVVWVEFVPIWGWLLASGCWPLAKRELRTEN